MSVRAKFWCTDVHHHHTGNAASVFAEVTLAAVYDDGANKEWSQATPTGTIKMGITNPAAIGQFELGKKYFIDFTPAE